MTDLINAGLVRLDADLGAEKHDVIRALAQGVGDAGRATDVDQLVEDAFAREATSATGLPGGIAIPHCRTTGVMRQSADVEGAPRSRRGRPRGGAWLAARTDCWGRRSPWPQREPGKWLRRPKRSPERFPDLEARGPGAGTVLCKHKAVGLRSTWHSRIVTPDGGLYRDRLGRTGCAAERFPLEFSTKCRALQTLALGPCRRTEEPL